jgi:aryl-alcohol dehydrogenase-like predicted oxidoreductase
LGVRQSANPNISVPQVIGIGLGIGASIPAFEESAPLEAGSHVEGLEVTLHAAKQFAERNFSREQLKTALDEGVKYFDTET